jgi:hypothetical protein
VEYKTKYILQNIHQMVVVVVVVVAGPVHMRK